MTLDLDIQRACELTPQPDDESFIRWASLALREKPGQELTIRLVDAEESRTLNRDYRGKDQPTNVLSFPAFEVAPGDAIPPMLGDIALAFETVTREAGLEEKPFDHHLTHLVVHGLLHLMGHDHEEDGEAEAMEALERAALARLAIPDPYG